MANDNSAPDMAIVETPALEREEEAKAEAAADAGNSSDDEGEVIPKVVENYYFTDENQEPIPFTVLPIDLEGVESRESSKKQVFLEGTADGGLQKVYKQAIAWKLNLQEQKPVLLAMIKEKAWIELQKPRKSYEEVIRSFLVAAHFLHFARKNPEASKKAYWDHLRKVFSTWDVKPTESDLLEHTSLIEGTYQRDQKLKKAEVLTNFVEMKPKKRKLSDEEMDSNAKDKKTKFLVSDEESQDDFGEDGLDESDEEEDDLFDSVCAICDNGGELLCCEGPCMRSFHPNREAGEESQCKSLCLTKAEIKEIQNFHCQNCKYKQHQCFECGKLGSSDKSLGAEVFCCVSATCGRFYHPHCVAKLIDPQDEADLAKRIAEGLQFTCPVHRCFQCKKTEQKEIKDLQFAICRRCPRAYHRKCLPLSISFDDDTDTDEPQRAWEGLIPNQILIYCRKHKIDPDLGTPRRNHIVFPEVSSDGKIIKRNHVISPESGMGKAVAKKMMKSSELIKEKIPVEFKEKVPSNSSLKKEKTTLPKVHSASELARKVTKERESPSSLRKEDKYSTLELKKSLSQKDGKTKSLELNSSKTVKGLTSKQEKKKPSTVLPTFTDDEIKSTVMAVVKRSSTGINLDDVYAKHQVPSTYRFNLRNLDKSVTQGKVEGSVEAVRTALRKLEEGGSIDDAKAVCAPDVIQQIVKWKNKLRVYLAPFLHGMRYTSFGRHFTKPDKLQEVVERLHWYVQSGDTIVDFCCGANDFSRLMKKKLEQSGKICFYKNFDIIQPKNDFEFEKRDFHTVDKDELPTGSRLIMGLNPPFGVRAALANKFIDKALEFLPKLLVLIVPKETKRLDEKPEQYDLIWEDSDLLKGESFYMPGSVDVDDNQLGQWNVKAPPLYLWSRPDWTAPHRAIAIRMGHVKNTSTAAENEVLDTKPSKDEVVNASKPLEGNLGSPRYVEKDKQNSVFVDETMNKSAVDYRENEIESKPDSVSLVHRLDGLKQKDVPLNKIKEEQRESHYERNVSDKKKHEEKNCDQKGSDVQMRDKNSDIHDEGHDRLALHFEQNHARRQEKGGYDEHGRQKHQKDKSPGKERFDKKEKPVKRRENRKRERPDKSMSEKERIGSSPPSKRFEGRKDEDDIYNSRMQEHNSLHINTTDGFGRPFDKGPGSRDEHVRGLQIGASEMVQEIRRGFRGTLPGDVEEGYGRGYHRTQGSGEEGFGRVHVGSSEEYGRGIHLSHSGNIHEEYMPAEVSRGFPRNFPGSLESEYSVSPSDLQVLQNNRVYNRQVQHDYEPERLRLLEEARVPDWLTGDSQRSRYHIEQASHINNAYARNPDHAPDMHHPLMLGQQHEETSHLHPRGQYLSEPFERSEITSSAMQRYAPRLDQNMNYGRPGLHHEQPPVSSFFGSGQVRGSPNFPFSSLGFASGPQNPYSRQSSSGWIDE